MMRKATQAAWVGHTLVSHSSRLSRSATGSHSVPAKTSHDFHDPQIPAKLASWTSCLHLFSETPTLCGISSPVLSLTGTSHTVESWAATTLVSQVSLLLRTTCNLYRLLFCVRKVCMCCILLYSHFGGRASLAPVHLSWLQRESLGMLFYCEYFALKLTEFF